MSAEIAFASRLGGFTAAHAAVLQILSENTDRGMTGDEVATLVGKRWGIQRGENDEGVSVPMFQIISELFFAGLVHNVYLHKEKNWSQWRPCRTTPDATGNIQTSPHNAISEDGKKELDKWVDVHGPVGAKRKPRSAPAAPPPQTSPTVEQSAEPPSKPSRAKGEKGV